MMKGVRLTTIGAHKGIEEIKSKLVEDYNIDLTMIKYSDIEIFIENNKTTILCKGRRIEDTDFVWINAGWKTRDLAYVIGTYLNEKDIPYTPVEQESSKLSDLLELNYVGISIPNTYYCNTDRFIEKLETIEKFCAYPFIIKTTKGSCGNGIHYIPNKTSFLKEVAKLDSHQNYTCQPFIPNDFDYRILVANSKVVCGEKRIREKWEYRNNVSLGAHEEYLDLEDIPAGVRELSIQAAETLGLKWSGVDIITSMDTGQHYILEVNRNPGVTAGSLDTVVAQDHIIELLTNRHLLTDR